MHHAFEKTIIHTLNNQRIKDTRLPNGIWVYHPYALLAMVKEEVNNAPKIPFLYSKAQTSPHITSAVNLPFPRIQTPYL